MDRHDEVQSLTYNDQHESKPLFQLTPLEFRPHSLIKPSGVEEILRQSQIQKNRWHP